MDLFRKASSLLTEYGKSQVAVMSDESEILEPFTIALPSSSTLSLAHQWSHGLRSLASCADVQAVGSLSRECVLAIADRSAQSRSSLTWNVHDGKVCPQGSVHSATLLPETGEALLCGV